MTDVRRRRTWTQLEWKMYEFSRIFSKGGFKNRSSNTLFGKGIYCIIRFLMLLLSKHYSCTICMLKIRGNIIAPFSVEGGRNFAMIKRKKLIRIIPCILHLSYQNIFIRFPFWFYDVTLYNLKIFFNTVIFFFQF